MIRTPILPLARVLKARALGQGTDRLEAEGRRARHEMMRDQARHQAELRLKILGVFAALGFALIGIQMTALAATDPAEPKARASTSRIIAGRADIVDRKGRILATNFETHSLYSHPNEILEPERAAQELAKIFPDLDAKDLAGRLASDRKFMWVKRRISPEQKQSVHDIGEPGLHFGPRDMRLYPNGALAAHILGGYSYGREGVHSAEVIGTAGVEKAFDDWLRDPAQGGAPLQLSVDLTIQDIVEEVLAGGMMLYNAKGASAVLMDVQTGEVLALASLPDFDPNDRPRPLTQGDQSDSVLFNRAVQGVYELGSVFKVFTIAQALDLGLVNPSTKVNTQGPLRAGKFRIRDFHNYGPELTARKVLIKSSNIGSARIAMQIGAERQRAFLRQLGLMSPTSIELVEGPGAQPLYPSDARWKDLSTMTISYGHGISTSPLHLAAAYATLANGGRKIVPTLVKADRPQEGPQVIAQAAAQASVQMLRDVVTEGTASLARNTGYALAGKTGTADKPTPLGGYYDDRTLTTFASIFPANDPKYTLIVTLDEPVDTTGPEPRRTAGWTAVPVAAEITRRVGPLLGLDPVIDPTAAAAITQAAKRD